MQTPGQNVLPETVLLSPKSGYHLSGADSCQCGKQALVPQIDTSKRACRDAINNIGMV